MGWWKKPFQEAKRAFNSTKDKINSGIKTVRTAHANSMLGGLANQMASYDPTGFAQATNSLLGLSTSQAVPADNSDGASGITQDIAAILKPPTAADTGVTLAAEEERRKRRAAGGTGGAGGTLLSAFNNYASSGGKKTLLGG